MRDELAEAAFALLASQGFEETTVDQIVAAVGMSRRTFSRYFQSKEDVVVHKLAEAGTQLCAELRARPASEPPAAALRQALRVFTHIGGDDPAKALRIAQLILGTPALLARLLERQSHWQQEMAGILAQRARTDAEAGLYPSLAAGLTLTAFQTALRSWADGDGAQSLDALIDQVFAPLASAIDRIAAKR
ncbi:TetR family transcriptional regulator [Nonomuraea sp. NPDC050022]|uniref:acyl-CoA-like ligand-binding transcription factor n=1 Tax=unclassified Nonomuraea TaxID=2593643 RepID=UPI0033C5582A